MTSTPWWQRAVLYQVYPRSFADGDGDGVGDLAGLVSRLDHLTRLGVDAVWLSPIYPSPMADFGYDVADHCDVDPLFGDLADAEALIAAAHARGLRVILDFVPNHTSDRHPWFLASRRSRTDPKRDWYVWADPAPDGGPPNNWLSRFDVGPAWTYDEATGQYYLHSFLPEQPDLNWRHPGVREAMGDVLRFWLDRGVDGFRVDVAHRIAKDPRLRDNPPNPDWHEGMAASARLLERRTRNWPELHDVLRGLRRVVDAYPDRVLIGEVNLDPAELMAFYGDGDELHLPLNFHTIVDLPWQAGVLADLVGSVEALLPDRAWPTWVLSNHDKPRFPTRLGQAHARAGLVFLLTVRGTPVLYYGDELALPDVDVPPEAAQDPWELANPGKGLGRDRSRTPMPWTGGPGAGFCPPDVAPWLPIGEDHRQAHVAAQDADPASPLALTRALLALRRRRPALATGDLEGLRADGGVLVYTRRAGADRVTVALNTGERPAVIDLGAGTVLLSSGLDRHGETLDGPLPLAVGEAVVIG